jgi:hypothetical protein
VLASLMGTTGAAMLLIRPVLRANAFRRQKTHTFVFFIFLVANIGGSLTPVGDPPLYLGFLRGVSFFWPTTHLFGEFLFCAVVLLAVYYVLDTLAWRREKPVPPAETRREALSIEGWHNVALVGATVAVVIAMGYVKLGSTYVLGQSMETERAIGIVLFAAITLVSSASRRRALREANGFAWGAILEVAKLFAAIFVCMAPVLAILRAGRDGAAAGLVALTSGRRRRADPLGLFLADRRALVLPRQRADLHRLLRARRRRPGAADDDRRADAGRHLLRGGVHGRQLLHRQRAQLHGEGHRGGERGAHALLLRIHGLGRAWCWSRSSCWSPSSSSCEPEFHPMPYVIASDLPEAPAGLRFRALLDRPQILQMPGAHLGIAALLAKKQGFEALYMSGAAMSATMGCPTSA